VKDLNGRRPLPAFATDAEPGSEAKICILEERAGLHQELHHPGDRRVGLARAQSA
jgi:hypothetical protein